MCLTTLRFDEEDTHTCVHGAHALGIEHYPREQRHEVHDARAVGEQGSVVRDLCEAHHHGLHAGDAERELVEDQVPVCAHERSPAVQGAGHVAVVAYAGAAWTFWLLRLGLRLRVELGRGGTHFCAFVLRREREDVCSERDS